MRYLIDTNIFVYLATDVDSLNRDVLSLFEEPDALLYMSAESVRELIVAYRNKGLCSKRWKSIEEMVVAIENDFYVKILPLKKEHMKTYAKMEINEARARSDIQQKVILVNHRLHSTVLLSISPKSFSFETFLLKQPPSGNKRSVVLAWKAHSDYS